MAARQHPAKPIARALIFLARHGKWCLVAGLVAGLTLPGLALTLKPWLPPMVGLLMFLSALRIGPARALGGLSDLRRTAGMVALYQVVLPLAVLACLSLAGGMALLPALVAVLVLSAPPVTGSPNFTALMGFDPAPAMRVLILGTAVFPLTVLPVLWALPVLGEASAVLAAAGRLLAVIGLAVGLGFAVHLWLRPADASDMQRSIDGASALTLAVLVVALMSALGPALRETPWVLAGWLGFAFALNLGLQVAGWRATGQAGYAIQAGNRNIALFLVALPAHVTDPILIFIGCYQLPMYLTPMIMPHVFGKRRD